MKIETIDIPKTYQFVVSELPDTDPVTIRMTSNTDNSGELTITGDVIRCSGYTWPSMKGGIVHFIASVTPDYLIDKLFPFIEKNIEDIKQLNKFMQNWIVEHRKNAPHEYGPSLSREDARALFNISDWTDYISTNPYEPVNINAINRLLVDVDGEVIAWPDVEIPLTTNPMYAKISRVMESAIKCAQETIQGNNKNDSLSTTAESIDDYRNKNGLNEHHTINAVAVLYELVDIYGLDISYDPMLALYNGDEFINDDEFSIDMLNDNSVSILLSDPESGVLRNNKGEIEIKDISSTFRWIGKCKDISFDLVGRDVRKEFVSTFCTMDEAEAYAARQRKKSKTTKFFISTEASLSDSYNQIMDNLVKKH